MLFASSSGPSPLPPKCLGVLAGLFALFCIPWGVYCLLHPRTTALIGKRWQFQGDVDPSDGYVFFTVIRGLITVALGIAAGVVAVLLILLPG